MWLLQTVLVFQLKPDNKNPHSSEYPDTISKYLGTDRKEAHINELLIRCNKKIIGYYMDSQEEASVEHFEHLPKNGEHVVVFWIKKEIIEAVWYLGIVNKIFENNEISNMYLKS